MSSKNISIIDYGVGNLLSVFRAFESQGAKPKFVYKPEEIINSDRVVLPGVGAYHNGMNLLEANNLVDPIREVSQKGTPLLGICLGMQLFADVGEEFGEHKGLSIISGRVTAIPQESIEGVKLRIPHTNWSANLCMNEAAWKSSVLKNNKSGFSGYFVHSYSVKTTNPEESWAATEYGGHKLVSVIGKDNVIGCQFHPEKSGKEGLKILKSFMEI